MIKIIIAGGKDFKDKENLIEIEMTQLCQDYDLEDIVVISGGEKGADSEGEKFAREFNTNLWIFPAQWAVLGKSAEYKRNKMMTDNADVLLAFWDGQSKGTRHMINIAKQKGLKLRILNYQGHPYENL